MRSSSRAPGWLRMSRRSGAWRVLRESCKGSSKEPACAPRSYGRVQQRQRWGPTGIRPAFLGCSKASNGGGSCATRVYCGRHRLRARSSTSCRCRGGRTSRSSRFNRRRRSKEVRDVTTTTQLREPPEVSGAEGEGGHLEELRHDPIGLMRRVREECGDVGEFRLAGRRVVLLSGAAANEQFFRASEEELNQAEAYPFMTPIF